MEQKPWSPRCSDPSTLAFLTPGYLSPNAPSCAAPAHILSGKGPLARLGANGPGPAQADFINLAPGLPERRARLLSLVARFWCFLGDLLPSSLSAFSLERPWLGFAGCKRRHFIFSANGVRTLNLNYRYTARYLEVLKETGAVVTVVVVSPSASFFHHAPHLMANNTFNSRPRPSPLTGLPLRPTMSVIGRRESMASTMEGALSVPPDRGTIIGRAVWKVGAWLAPLMRG